MEFRRSHAVAREYNRSRYGAGCMRVGVKNDVVAVVRQRVLPPARFDHQRTARRVDFSAPQSDGLEVAAVLDSALEAERGELSADVFRRYVVAARAETEAE